MMKRLGSEAGLEDRPRRAPGSSKALPQVRSPAGTNGCSNDGIGAGGFVSPHQHFPQISRKIKACASCRKQKVRCLMSGDGPPCKRCDEKGLSCVLNKSLQTLINERIPSTDSLFQDLETIHSGVQRALQALNLPLTSPLQSSRHATAQTPVSSDATGPNPSVDDGPSCDNSPRLSPEDDSDLPNVPIHSIYHLTKLRALRASESDEPAREADAQNGNENTVDDFISQGQISLEDAESLFDLYNTRLDPYIYGVGARYTSLCTLRRASPILTAAILTVAAMHEPRSNRIYPLCNREFRRLMTASLFERRLDRDHLRALGIASYWFNDASWILSGVASRRAAECNIMSYYRQLSTEDSEDAADFVRIWYLVYICDQHLATLYGRQSVWREDAAIQGWEALTRRPAVTAGDKRLVSQVALLIIIHNIRELFGSETDQPVPAVFSTHVKGFARQLDQWVGRWTTELPEVQEGFGSFPRKGAQFHFLFAKLYLYSHVFRGLRNSPVAPHFCDEANGAVAAATSILNMIITDADVRIALVGLPCYVQSMIGFACMFLAKLISTHAEELVDRSAVTDLVARLLEVYRATPVGKWHLVHLMADGLEKILAALQRQGAIIHEHPATQNHLTQADSLGNVGYLGQLDFMADLDPQLMVDMGMGLGSSFHPFMGADFQELDGNGEAM